MMFTYKSTEPLNYIILDCSKSFIYLKISIPVLPLNILFLPKFADVCKIHNILRTHMVKT